MPSASQWCFGAFRLDAATTCLWRDEQLVPSPPDPWRSSPILWPVPGRWSPRTSSWRRCGPRPMVSEGVLKTCLAQIRRVLGETARTPQYIATVHRRGYRFMAPVTMQEPSASRARGMAADCRRLQADVPSPVGLESPAGTAGGAAS